MGTPATLTIGLVAAKSQKKLMEIKEKILKKRGRRRYNKSLNEKKRKKIKKIGQTNQIFRKRQIEGDRTKVKEGQMRGRHNEGSSWNM